MAKIKKLILLHSNDLHGDFLAEEVEGKYVGGVSLLSGYVKQTKQAEENVIYAIAGDLFRGSVIDEEYLGISTVEIMNMLSPDVVTIGNHEFDYGMAHLLFAERCAKFPFINANLYSKVNEARLFTPCKVIETGGMKVLFIGVVSDIVMAQARKDPLMDTYVYLRDAAREIGKVCNAYRSTDIDLTVVLSHIGIEEDKALAKNLDPAWGVDMIIGGHSHTFMEQPIEENGIVIAHAGTGVDALGRFEIMIDTDDNCIASYNWSFVPINNETAVRDEELERKVRNYKEATDKKYEHVMAKFSGVLTHPKRNMETALGNLFADIFRESAGVDIMLMASGSIRSKELGAIVTRGDLRETFPFDDALYVFKVTGKMLKHMLTYMLREETFTEHTEFYQLSGGMKITYSRSEKAMKQFTFNGVTVGDDDVFSLGMQSFHFTNIEDFLNVEYAQLEKLQRPRMIATSCVDVLDEFFMSNDRRIFTGEVEGRIEIIP